MADLKSKEEWFQLVCNKLQIVPEPKDIWKSPRTNMALTEYGLYLFEKAGIEFYEFEVDNIKNTSRFILGLTRIPCPYYLGNPTNLSKMIFKLSSYELATYFSLIDRNLEIFTEGFTDKNEIV